MNRKLNVSQLKKIIREQVKLLVEGDKKELKDSLDQQVDDLLTSYESEAKTKKNEGLDFRMMTRRFLSSSTAQLLEADEDKGSDKEKEEKKKLKMEDIDVEEFAGSVSRLIDNYDSLLEVRNTLARRAVNFLIENYEQDVVNEFKNVLEDS
ncbi:hypothetical protein EBR43_09350, partial [bacterium]|nr:hypothetical protein [bacterium]